MNISKKTVVFLSVILVAVSAIMLFYAGDSEENTEKMEVYIKEENIEKTKDEQLSEFSVCLEEDCVILYQRDNGIVTELERVKIDPHYYPEEDIKELSRGISAYNKEEGYEILENFAN